MYSCLWYNVRVEPVAEIDRIDIITGGRIISACTSFKLGAIYQEANGDQCLPFQVTIHYGEEDLQKEVDRVY